jgi:acyl-CoA synthetase (AMP-forming)/AMP-acid ligase II
VVNVATYLADHAVSQPYKRAVVCVEGRDGSGRAAYTHLTFRQLDSESDRLAHGLAEIGIRRGTRTILMVRPGLEFFTLTFALFKVGAVPVVVDPGMGIKRMLGCLRESRPAAFVGIPPAHALRALFPAYFRTVKTRLTVGRRWFWGGPTYGRLRHRSWRPYPKAATRADETAAILFTTGSTGPAKGAVYAHGTFDAQIRHIRAHFNIEAGEIDLPTFPLFALFDPALGMTAVIPEMDPTRPAEVDPLRIIEPIVNQGVTNMFASPALLDRVGRFGRRAGLKLPSLKRVVSAGAPVAPANIERFAGLLTGEAQIHTPYGATEAVPVLSIASREILSNTRHLTERGFGVCVGRPLEGLRVELIKVNDEPIGRWSEKLPVPSGEIGEITVKGPLVTRSYFSNPTADALSKIEENGQIWHRMGDLGWKDSRGRFWFCGRKNHRVITRQGTLYTIPCESIFNNHPRVRRSALVGIGEPPDQRPVICIELVPGSRKNERARIRRELLALAVKSDLTREIETVLFHESFPVDIRHNAKIFREKLAVWAQKRAKSDG